MTPASKRAAFDLVAAIFVRAMKREEQKREEEEKERRRASRFSTRSPHPTQ